MVRSGCAIGSGFLLFLAFGRPEAAVICAFFTNFLCLSDKADHVITRVWVQAVGGLVFAGLGFVGVLVSGNPPLILVTVFSVALFTGFVHGTTPGVEAIPRFGLVCLTVAAFNPVSTADTLAAILLGTPIAVATVLLDDYARNGRRGPYIKRMRANVSYPSPRFGLIYAIAAAIGMAIGLMWSDMRPYWVTVTTLVSMAPDRRANTVRVAQRFLGTLGGVVLAFIVVMVLPDRFRHHGLFILSIALPFIWPIGYYRNYGLGVAILCAWVLLVIDSEMANNALATPVFLARLSETAMGCAIALIGSFVVYEAEVAEDESTT